MNAKNFWKILTVLELAAAVVVILLDLLIPTIIILGMTAVSLLVRRETTAVLGFKKPRSWLRMIVVSAVSVIFLQLFDIGLVMPVLNRLTHSTIVNSGFEQLQGNFQQLLVFVLLGWTLAALGEEIVYRGYLHKLMADLFGSSALGIGLTIGLSSLLFGLAHLEQGMIGVIVTTIDAIFFSLLKRKYDNNLWAAILAHGFYNTIGMIVFYFTGPIYGLW